MKHTFAFLLSVFIATLSPNAVGDLKESSAKLCEKMKQCAYADMEQEELTPQMKAMMEGMLNQMCANFAPSVDLTMGNAMLEKKAQACFDSMIALSCDDINEMQGDTPACREVEKAVEQLFSK